MRLMLGVGINIIDALPAERRGRLHEQAFHVKQEIQSSLFKLHLNTDASSCQEA